MYAVIKTGGKQYRVAADDVIQVERLAAQPGEIVEIKDVLMLGGSGEPMIGAPLVEGASVAAEVVEQTRGPKLVVYKKRRRKHYQRRNGHRQLLTTVKITEILTDGRKPAEAKAAKDDTGAEPKPAKAAKAKAAKPAVKAAAGQDEGKDASAG